MIPGGPTDADTDAGLAQLMAREYMVVTYDPRGNSRSVFDQEPMPQNMNTHGDDLALLVQSLDRGPALIFGNSGGAQIGLNFTARYPSLVRRLVAHEPPCIPLLSDAAKSMEEMRAVKDLFHAKGTGPGMGAFLQAAGMPPRPAATASQQSSAQDPSSFERAARSKKNIEYFLEHGVPVIGEYTPDIAALKKSDVVIGAGRESEGQLAYRTAASLASKLGTNLILFPLDHSSWARTPDDFSKTLFSVLKDAK